MAIFMQIQVVFLMHKTSYKYRGLIDVNADGTKETIYTNKESGRWVGSIDSSTENDYEEHGQEEQLEL